MTGAMVGMGRSNQIFHPVIFTRILLHSNVVKDRSSTAKAASV
jgi:hypothetical protein